MLTKSEIKESVEKARLSDKDVGSSPVQVSILTSRINKLSEHLNNNKKDLHSRKGLLKLIGERRKHLSYLKRKGSDIYEETISKLGLRK